VWARIVNVMFTHEPARRFEDAGVTVNCLHPGVVATNLFSDQLPMR
jgi:NAD(P)-dependent dehydrogenase (short-subunit alcohol dehydrogenase family)